MATPKHLSIHLLVCVALLTALPAHADLLANIRAAGKIRIAMASAVPPFNFLDTSKQLTGSDLDTAHLLAQDLGVKLEIVRITNSERIATLTNKRSDLVISALSITAEREREIAFSVPYARIAVVIAAPAPYKMSSMLDLNGKTVGALTGSSNLAHLRQNSPGAKTIEYAENDKMSSGYVAEEFEIMTAPESIVDSTNNLSPKRPLQVQFTQMEFDVAIGIPKGEKSLRDWVNAWVVKRLHDHSLGEIYRKYHGRNLPDSIIPTTTGVKGK